MALIYNTYLNYYNWIILLFILSRINAKKLYLFMKMNMIDSLKTSSRGAVIQYKLKRGLSYQINIKRTRTFCEIVWET